MGMAKDLVDAAVGTGCDAIKFQMLRPDQCALRGNVMLPWDWLPILVGYGGDRIEVFASAFDAAGVNHIRKHCKSIKFAYSQQNLRDTFPKTTDTIYTSYGVIDPDPEFECIKLFCIPEYPVYYRPSFVGIFPRFDGFSDHTMGIDWAVIAATAGAKYIEKHIRLDSKLCESVPDGRFAIRPKGMARLVAETRSLHGDLLYENSNPW
jgi:sialic acid synthase SpsE